MTTVRIELDVDAYVSALVRFFDHMLVDTKLEAERFLTLVEGIHDAGGALALLWPHRQFEALDEDPGLRLVLTANPTLLELLRELDGASDRGAS